MAPVTEMANRALAPWSLLSRTVASSPDSHFFLPNHVEGHQIVVKSEEEGRQHRIALNSLYLFSSKSINYEANGGVLHNYTRGEPISSSLKEASEF